MKQLKLLIYGFLFMSVMQCATVGANNRSEFEQWLQQETSSFQEYKDKRDREFTQFLKTQWREMQTFQGLVRDETPKPVSIPVAKPEPHIPIVEKIIAEKPIKKISDFKIPPKKLPVQKPEPVKPAPVVRLPQGQKIQLNFYGQTLAFSYDPKLKIRLADSINEKAMSRHWSELSKADYESLIKQLQQQRNPLQLNDWAYVLLIHEVAGKIYPAQQNERMLLIWFVLAKEGYSARIAYDDNQVYLLLPAEQQLYAAPYFTLDGIRYYALGLEGVKQNPGKVFTYDGQYPGASKLLNMRLDKTINTQRKQQNRQFKFVFQGRHYLINAENDLYTVDFLKTYPQMDIALYYVAEVNTATGNLLLEQLRPLLVGRSEQEAVNLLLRFVQTAFPYKTDESQFGVENYLFPEETLYYPYSDCEDRSVFFAWLVRNLLGLDIVGLDYPGHIAAAIRFNQAVKGDGVDVNGRRFVVTDPTYINATVGMTMPAYRNHSPKIIDIVF